MFKRYYGQCVRCLPGVVRVIVVKSGLCQQHNEEKKNAGKPPKEKKPRIVKKKEPRYGQCKLCPENTSILLVVRHYCREHNDQRKREARSIRSMRVAKLVDKAERMKSHPELKKKLWDIFSEYIRLRDSKDGMFTCISCHRPQESKDGNLQAGHYYKSETYPALRYDPFNVNGQCLSCNIFKEGNRQGYEEGILRKYGQAVLDRLKARCHNKVRLSRFELELLIKEYTQKLDELKKKI